MERLGEIPDDSLLGEKKKELILDVLPINKCPMKVEITEIPY